MKDAKPKKNEHGYREKDISLVRKISIWIFIVGFWLLYYWFQGQKASPLKQKPTQKNSVNNDIKIPTINSSIDKKSTIK